MEQDQRADGVHLKVMAHLLDGCLQRRVPAVGDSGVGDDDVKGGDSVLRVQEFDYISSVSLGDAFNLDDDEFAAGANWERVQARY